MRTKRLIGAMCVYAVIAVLAAFTLDGGLLRNGVWVLMAFFAVKSYIAYRAGWTLSTDEHHDADDAQEPAEENGHR
jgi:hypothetical protein